MDESNYNNFVNQLLQNAPIGAGPSRMPIIPIPSTTVHTPAQVTTSTNTVPRPNTSVTASRADPHRVSKRVQQQYIHQYNMSPAGTSLNGLASYGGAYNNHLYNRPYMNNMGLGGNYNHYNSYGQPMITPKYQNPTVIAAAEGSRPAFDSIWSIVESFNAVSMMLETTLAAMQTSFQALLTVAENFTRLKMFMMKFYSTIVSLKLLRWFLTKLFYLSRMVRGGIRGTITEEKVWTAISDTNQVTPNGGLYWPVVVYTGLFFATPYFAYKLFNTAKSLPETPSSAIKKNKFIKEIVLKSLKDWSSQDPKTIPLVKEATYMASRANYINGQKKGGWLFVDDLNGKSGFVPFKMLKVEHYIMTDSQSQSVTPDISNVTFNIVPPISEQIPPPQSMSPIIDVHDNPIDLPHPFLDGEKLKNDIE